MRLLPCLRTESKALRSVRRTAAEAAVHRPSLAAAVAGQRPAPPPSHVPLHRLAVERDVTYSRACIPFVVAKEEPRDGSVTGSVVDNQRPP